jgi:carboxymethylenebutenolidase
MQEHHFDLSTPDGDMPTWVMHPDGDGPFPVVLFLMDAPGMRQETRDMAMRVATSGYWVITSQLYYREVREYCLFDETPTKETLKHMYTLMNGLSNDMVDADTAAMLAHAATDTRADPRSVGVVGYCMSGPFAVSVAAAHPDVVRAAASFHGVALATDRPDSPHLRVANTNAEIYVAHAELDTHIEAPEVAVFDAALQDSAATGWVETFDGLDHGFTFPTRPAYDRIGAETHWERLLDLFDRNLNT